MSRKSKTKGKSRGKSKGKGIPKGAGKFDDPKCEKCNALCCKYIAMEIDGPDDEESVDHLRWYLLHQDVSIYVQDGEWHLCVDVRCKHLDDENRCRIHDTRPQICRDHSPDECEFGNPDYELEQEFRSWDHLEAYLIENGYL